MSGKLRFEPNFGKFDDYHSFFFYQATLDGWGEYFCSNEYSGDGAELIPLGNKFDFLEACYSLGIDAGEPTQEIVDEIERASVAIVYWDSQGFVSCDLFNDAREAYTHWKTIEKHYYPEEFEDE